MDDMGLDTSRLQGGLEVGLLSVAPIAALVAAGVAMPPIREFFLDSDVVGASGGRALYEVLVRIPLGTALAEELIFRGALMGMLLRRRSPLVAVLLSSAVFGVWHVSPTLHSLSTNPAAARAATGFWARLGIVSVVVAATAAAGAGLARLRLESGSIVAPWLAHACLNSFAYLGGRVAAGLRR